jgi:hypothetical protein
MTMAENAPDQGQAAAKPPVDPRPQPRYGELAPEGWTWTPPQDADAPAASAPVGPAVPAGPATQHPTARPGASAPGSAPGWDRPVTMILLVVGLLGTFFTVSVLASLPEALQMLYTQADLGTYTADPSVGTIITVGSIGQAVIWLAAAVGAVLLTLKNRRAFYIPLIGGVVAFVLVTTVIAVILAGDAPLLDYFSRP